MYEHLLYTKSEKISGLLTITLNRPEVFNAINQKIGEELLDAFKQAAKDPAVRVVVLTAEGKAFCSGQDLKEVKASNDSGQKRSLADSLHNRYNPIIRAMKNLPKPIIGRINGVAAGAGASLALACDMVIAAEEVNLIEIFINIGLVPDSGSSWFLPHTIGLAKAFELCSMGNKVSAAEAVRLGLFNKAVPMAELDAAVEQVATYYASAPTLAIGLIKKMLNKALTSSLDEQLDYEAYCQEIAGRSDDYKEGVTAFIEKRKAVYQGK